MAPDAAPTPLAPRRPRRHGAALAGVVLALGLLLPPPAAAEWSAVVFMYHRFGEADYPSTSVPLERFDRQLDWLQAQGFAVWPLARLAQARDRGAPVPERTLAISIDDAYASVYTEAWPRLRARGWPFTVFVATDGVDAGQRGLLTWEQMREMQAAGVAFANHSASHDYLWRRNPGETTSAWRGRVGNDIERAQRRLQQELGPGVNEAPRLFAYPYGEYSDALAELVSEAGYLAFGQQSGALGLLSDPRALPRYPVNADYSELSDFALKALSLALPVSAQTPWSPLVTSENPPLLELRLAASSARLDALTCYATGQGRIAVEAVAGQADRYRVHAPAPLAVGRSRYNCTAPQRGGNRWYWFSQPWIRSAD